MKKTWSRRQFFKAAGAGGAGVGIASMLDWAGLSALAKPSIPERVQRTLTQAPATALPASLPLGAPLANISTGWDGSLWGVDTNGVPHTFNQLSQAWEIVGRGFDSVAIIDDQRNHLVVRGAEVSFYGREPQSLDSVWQNLPDSFKLGLDGVAMAAGVLYLFRSGRYVAVDKATNTAGAPVALTTLSGWPTADHWQHGVIDAVGAHANDIENPYIMLWSQGEYVFVDMTLKQVTDGPHDLAYFVTGDMLTVMQQGFSSVYWSYDPVC